MFKNASQSLRPRRPKQNCHTPGLVGGWGWGGGGALVLYMLAFLHIVDKRIRMSSQEAKSPISLSANLDPIYTGLVTTVQVFLYLLEICCLG